MRLVRFAGKLLFIFIVGGIGGGVATYAVVPRLAGYPLFEKVLGPGARQGVTVINPKEEIIIDKADAVRISVARAKPTVVLVERLGKTGELEASATGVILAQDGFVATDPTVVVSPGSLFVVREGERIAAKLSRIDSENGVALVKVEARGLPVPNFGSADALQAGDTAFGIRAFRDEEKTFIAEVRVGNVAYTRGNAAFFSFAPGRPTRGMPVFNTKGELIGIAHSGAQAGGEDRVASAAVIKELLTPR